MSASSDYGVSIVESFAPPKNWLPGQTVNKDVYAVNTGNIDAYVKEDVAGVLNYTYEDLVTTYGAASTKYVELTLDQVKAIEGHTEEDGFKTNEAGGFLAWTNAKTEAVPESYEIGGKSVTLTTGLTNKAYVDDTDAAAVDGGKIFTVSVVDPDDNTKTYYAESATNNAQLYSITTDGIEVGKDKYEAVAGKTLTVNDAVPSVPTETGSVNSGRTQDITKPWTPTETGVYVFRRAINTKDATNPFTYSGYYYDAATKKYYKIVLGSDNYPAASVDKSVTPVKFVYDIYADSKDVVASVTNDIDPDTGAIKTDVGYMFVIEKEEKNKDVTFKYDQNGDKPRLVAEYTVASTGDGTYDANALAARAQVEYQNALGQYDAAKASYDNAVANHAYGKALAEAEQALYDAKVKLDQKYADVNGGSGAKAQWEAARDAVNAAAKYTDDGTGTKPTGGADNGIRARTSDITTALDDLEDGIKALKPVTDATATYKVGTDDALVTALGTAINATDSASANPLAFNYSVVVNGTTYYATADATDTQLYTVSGSTYTEATGKTLTKTDNANPGIMPDEVMQAIAGTPAGNPYVEALHDSNSEFYKAFKNYEAIYKEIYGDGMDGSGGLYKDVTTALATVKEKSDSATVTDTGSAAAAKTASSTLVSKADQLKTKMAALKKAYTDFVNAANLVSGMNTTADTTAAITSLTTMGTIAGDFYTNADKLDDLVDTYVQEEKEYNEAKQALTDATNEWKAAVAQYNTDVAAAQKAYNSDTAADNSAKKQITDANAWDTNNDPHVFEDRSDTIVPAYSAIPSGTDPVIPGDAETPTSDYYKVYNYTGDTTAWPATTANVTLKDIDTDDDKDVDDQLEADKFATKNMIGVTTNRDAVTDTKTEAQWKDAIENATTGYQAVTAAKKAAYDAAVAAKNGGSTLKFYVNLASDWNTYWTMDPDTDETTDVDFYLNKVLEAGETSHKLIDSVEFDKNVSAGAYKDLTFDLNVGLDSIQVTYDENQRGYTTDAVNADANFAGMKAAVTAADANGNNVTWTDNAGVRAPVTP